MRQTYHFLLWYSISRTTIFSQSHTFHDCTKAWLLKAGFLAGIYPRHFRCHTLCTYVLRTHQIVLYNSQQFTKYRLTTAIYTQCIHTVWILIGVADSLPYHYLQSCAAPGLYRNDKRQHHIHTTLLYAPRVVHSGAFHFVKL